MRAARSYALRCLSNKKWREFQLSQVGQPLTAVVLDRRDARTGRLEALTDNYITVALEAAERFVGCLVDLSIEAVTERETLGRLRARLSGDSDGSGGNCLTESLEAKWPRG